MKTLAVLLCFLMAGCATPVSPSTPFSTPAPTTSPIPSPSPSVVFTCPNFPAVGSSGPTASPVLDCASAEAAVLRAVAGLGYPVRIVTVQSGDFCGGPFPLGIYACPTVLHPASAYVWFVGTDMVAAVLIGTERGGPQIEATVGAFEVPPIGWLMP